MTEPAFNAPASVQARHHLEQTIDHTFHRLVALGPGADTEGLAKSLTIAIEGYVRQVVAEAVRRQVT